MDHVFVSTLLGGRTGTTLAGLSRARLAAASMVLLLAGAAPAQDAQILVQGAPLVGSSNGMFFDADNNLYVANVFGQTISLIDPETGEILEQLPLPDDPVGGPMHRISRLKWKTWVRLALIPAAKTGAASLEWRVDRTTATTESCRGMRRPPP